MKRAFKIFLTFFLLLGIILFSIRQISPREIDDISPQINSEKKYMEKSEILWVIPKYNNIPISQNKTWCQEIISMNKTLGLHGITHTYKEFKLNTIQEEELKEAIKIFEDCFNQTPKIFKAPQLALSKENKKLLEKNKLKIRTPYHQTIHKVYHTQNTGTLPNWFHDLI